MRERLFGQAAQGHSVRSSLGITRGASGHILAGMSMSEYGVDGWTEAVGNLHASMAHDAGDMRTAYEAVADLWSEYGYQDVPTEVIRMLVNAIEIGYIAALNDIRDGDLDDEMGQWRPELARAVAASTAARPHTRQPCRKSVSSVGPVHVHRPNGQVRPLRSLRRTDHGCPARWGWVVSG